MSFFESLFGDQGQSALKKANKQAQAQFGQGQTALDVGQQNAIPAIDTATQQTVGTYAPFLQTGTQGLNDYYGLLNNPDSIYNSDLYKSRETATLDAVNRGANSRGMLASGNNTLDIINAMRQGGLDYFNTLTNAYNPILTAGQFGATGTGGAYQAGGANKANIYTGTAANKANLYGSQAGATESFGQNLATARAASQSAPWDFILGLANAGAKAYAGA